MLKAEVSMWHQTSHNGDTSRPFTKQELARIAGHSSATRDEVMKVFRACAGDPVLASHTQF